MTQKDKNRYDKIQSSNNKAKKQKWQNTKRQITNVTKDKLQIRQNTNQSITNMKNYHVIFVICCLCSENIGSYPLLKQTMISFCVELFMFCNFSLDF